MATSAAVRAGKAEVEVGINGKRINSDLKSVFSQFGNWAGSATKSLSKSMRNIGLGTAGIGAGLSAVAASVTVPLAAAVSDLMSYSGEVVDMADRKGIHVKAFQELAYAAKITGVSIQEVGGGFRAMQKTISEASHGNKEAAATLRKLGVTAEGLKGLSTDEQFAKIADGLNRVKSASDKTALAMKVFGKAGVQLLPLFQEGSAGLEAMKHEARRLGVVLDGDAITAADEFTDAWIRFKTVSLGVSRNIASALIPVLRPVVDWSTNAAGAVSKWTAENKELFRTIAGGAAVIGGAGAVLIGLGTAVVGVGLALSAASTVAATFAAGLGVLLSPLGIIATLAGAAVVKFTNWAPIVKELKSLFGGLGETAKTAFAGITDALAAGNLDLAGEVLSKSFDVAWLQVKSSGMAAWNGVMEYMTAGGATVVGQLATIFNFDFIGANLKAAVEIAFAGVKGFGIKFAADFQRGMIVIEDFFKKIPAMAQEALQGIGKVSANDAASFGTNLSRIVDYANESIGTGVITSLRDMGFGSKMTAEERQKANEKTLADSKDRLIRNEAARRGIDPSKLTFGGTHSSDATVQAGRSALDRRNAASVPGLGSLLEAGAASQEALNPTEFNARLRKIAEDEQRKLAELNGRLTETGKAWNDAWQRAVSFGTSIESSIKEWATSAKAAPLTKEIEAARKAAADKIKEAADAAAKAGQKPINEASGKASAAANAAAATDEIARTASGTFSARVAAHNAGQGFQEKTLKVQSEQLGWMKKTWETLEQMKRRSRNIQRTTFC